jgi:2,4-dienoyl-CoA reductase-like NADH-dependent reductase (Old Yellow Enzyme family)
MCQYSSVNGVVGDWHRAHIGALASGRPGLIVMEATAVSPEGRISIACPGLWNDEQANAFVPLTNFAHSQGVKMGIQLAHAGRKASTMRPWDDHLIATNGEGGWQPVAPSPIAFPDYPEPHELTISEIKDLVNKWSSAAKRAFTAGFDFVEIHAAHGYLLHEFLSPLTNQRTDEYGGSFENRIRFLVEVAQAIREVIPTGAPLFTRISATDWVDGGWDQEQSIELAKVLKEVGVDLIDTSTGGLIHNAKIPAGPGFQVPFGQAIRNATGVMTSSVGIITDPLQAEEIVANGKADAVMLGREMLRNPRWPLYAAQVLGKDVAWPEQLVRAKK